MTDDDDLDLVRCAADACRAAPGLVDPDSGLPIAAVLDRAATRWDEITPGVRQAAARAARWILDRG